ncbi:hypothetical protein LWI28_020489 [Acer negundo]|uniref:Uncharacterized protein n=1 Tax=Acer negundo TaxID=4023 RepID=A0AAD5IFC9_ACENE|nr:hypothetical protein LWI28_020489 [Acer negundo]
MAAEELGLLLNGNRFLGDQTNMIPNRSGSAPPSMEGSFAAIGNLLAKQNSSLNSSSSSLSNALGIMNPRSNCEDFPHTPSPVYNQSHSSSTATSEEPIDHDVLAVSLDVSSVNISKVPESTDVCVDASTVDGNNVALISNNDPLATSFSSLPCPDDTQISPTRQLDDTSTKKSGLEDDSSVSAVPQSDVSKMDLRMRKKQEEQQHIMGESCYNTIHLLNKVPCIKFREFWLKQFRWE